MLLRLTADQFAERVRAVGGATVPPVAVRATVKACQAANVALVKENVSDVAAMAVAIAAEYSRSGVLSRDASRALASPAARLDRLRLTVALRPEADRLRTALFGRADPPFQGLPAAFRWLTHTAEAQPAPSPRRQAEARRLLRSVGPPLVRVGRLLRCEVRAPQLERLSLPVLEGHTVIEEPADHGTPLAELAATINRLAADTGASRLSLLAFILCGLPPVIPRVGVRLVDQASGKAAAVSLPPFRVAVVTLRGRDVSAGEFRALYRELREGLGVSRLKTPTAAHANLAALVEELGGEPPAAGERQESRAAFWRRVLAEWNRRYPSRHYQTWRGIEMRYRRLMRAR